jgi:hypothetical protein
MSMRQDKRGDLTRPVCENARPINLALVNRAIPDALVTSVTISHWLQLCLTQPYRASS